ncbi:hypothetical protein Bca4012_057702 [Brassica carinata]
MQEEEDIPRRRSVDVMNRLTRRGSVEEAAYRFNRRKVSISAITRTSGEPIATAIAAEKRGAKRNKEKRRKERSEEKRREKKWERYCNNNNNNQRKQRALHIIIVPKV